MKLTGKPGVMLVAGTCAVAFMSIGFLVSFSKTEIIEAHLPDRKEERCMRARSAFGFSREGDCSIASTQTENAKYNLENLAASFARPDSTAGKVTALQLITGEKSVVAGRGEYMSMGIVELEGGNLAPDGTRVEFLLGDRSSVYASTIGGVAHEMFKAPDVSGYVEVSGRTHGITTMANTVRVVPSEPLQVAASTKVRTGRSSDDRQIWFDSEVLEDAYGNRITDGSLVQFAGRDEQGRHMFLNAISVNGIAATKFIQREMSGRLALLAQHKDIIGRPVNFSLMPVTLNRDLPVTGMFKSGEFALEIGPLRHSRGAYVADGFEVEILLPDGRQYNALTHDGMVHFRFSMAELPKGSKVEIRAGGQVWYLEFGGKGKPVDTRSAFLLTGAHQ